MSSTTMSYLPHAPSAFMPLPPTATSTTRATSSSSAARLEHAAHLADIRRGASLSDVRVEVNVAHTKSRLKARFFVEMARVDSATGRVVAKWGIGVFMSGVKAFESQLLRLVKKHTSSSGRSSGHKTAAALLLGKKTPRPLCTDCAMCSELRREMKRWDKLSSFEAIGKRHMDTKCALVTTFFYRLLAVVHTRAQWLHDCELLREILRRTEAFCRIEYPNDRDALCIIASLQRVAPLPATATKATTAADLHVCHDDNDNDGDDCAICLSSLHERTGDITSGSESSAPARGGVELGCGHRFHDTCICLWFHTRLNCPICRTHAVCTAPRASEQ